MNLVFFYSREKLQRKCSCDNSFQSSCILFFKRLFSACTQHLHTLKRKRKTGEKKKKAQMSEFHFKSAPPCPLSSQLLLLQPFVGLSPQHPENGSFHYACVPKACFVGSHGTVRIKDWCILGASRTLLSEWMQLHCSPSAERIGTPR